uniref:C2H2-type domain-containing protein n=1 Tax=Anopheles minimus TaxID=112268 RepID=A0A182W0E4_9DIPT
MVGRKSVGGVRTSGTKKGEILVNVQVNGNDEIDLVPVNKKTEYGSTSDDDRDGDEEEDFEELSDNPDSDPDLLETADGRLILDMKRSKYCGKCKKIFKTLSEQKAHKYKCPGVVDEVQDVILKERKAAKHANPGEEFHKYCNPNPDNPCYCCGEDVSTAHVGHIRCKFCPKSFKAYEYMERHLTSIHSESDAFPCCYCNAKCNTQIILDEHLKTHDEGKPYACMACGKDFTRRKFFTTKSAILLHQRTHTEENPVQCKVCSGTFKRTDCLMRHMRTKHRDYLEKIIDDTEKEQMNKLVAKREAEKEATVEIDGAVYQITTMDDGPTKENASYSSNQTVEVFEVVEIPSSTSDSVSTMLPTTSVPYELIPIVDDTGIVLDENDVEELIAQSTINLTQPNVEVVKKEKDLHNKSKSPSNSFVNVRPKSTGSSATKLINKTANEGESSKVKNVSSPVKPTGSGTPKSKPEGTPTRSPKESPPKSIAKQTKQSPATKVESPKQVKPVTAPTAARPKEAKAKTVDETKVKRKREPKSSGSKRARTDEDSIPIFLSDDMLEQKISELLQMLMGDDMLRSFGWPNAPVEEVLGRVIMGCGHQPTKGEEVGDHTTRMRENTKILFSVTMDDDDIKALLNNHTVDEVIMHVLKNK